MIKERKPRYNLNVRSPYLFVSLCEEAGFSRVMCWEKSDL
jgi:hypothetical protein